MSPGSYMLIFLALLEQCSSNDVAVHAVTSTLPPSFTLFTQVTSVITTILCGGCYGVADIVTAVLGDFNASNSTVATVSIGQTQFTFANGLPIPTSISLTSSLILEPTITISGLTIASPTGYYIISAYSITSLASVNGGTCSTSSGPPAQTGPFSYTFKNQPAVDLAYAESAFEEQLGLSCPGVNGADPTQVTFIPNETFSGGASSLIGITNTTSTTDTTTAAVKVSPTSPSLTVAEPSASPTSSPSTSPSPTAARLSAGAKIGLGIGIPLGAIVVAMIGFFFWHRGRRQSQAKKLADNNQNPEGDPSMYLQHKAELDAEQRRHETEANVVRREMEAGERYELEVEERRQELRGEDHSQELEVPLRVAAAHKLSGP